MDGRLHFYVDYRNLNAVSVRDAYPIPLMNDSIGSIGDSTVFSTLDAYCGYWQVEVVDADREKTTFTFPHGFYRLVRMPFGLKNHLETIQRGIYLIPSSILCNHDLVYLQDVFSFSKTPTDHIKHVRSVLALLHDAGVTLKLNKSIFFSANIAFLGNIIRAGELEVAEH